MSRPYFVSSIVPYVHYRGVKLHNKAVNLALCASIEPSRIYAYPDNEGIPSLKFNGCDAEWAFNTEDGRNSDYERILKLYGMEGAEHD